MIKSAYEKRFPFQAPVLWSLLVGLLFIAAFGLRLYHIDGPPMDFHPTRQYHSAVMARGYYFEASDSAPEWKRELAILNERREGIIEPPSVEVMAFLAYRAVGGEHLWIPRLLSAVFWLKGGADTSHATSAAG